MARWSVRRVRPSAPTGPGSYTMTRRDRGGPPSGPPRRGAWEAIGAQTTTSNADCCTVAGRSKGRAAPMPYDPAVSASIDASRFREVLGHFASGVTVVTAAGDDPVGFTCQAFAALSLEPPMVLLAPSKTSTSWPRIAEAGAFCVNILASDQEDLARSFSVSGGDKFIGVGWERAPATGA